MVRFAQGPEGGAFDWANFPTKHISGSAAGGLFAWLYPLGESARGVERGKLGLEFQSALGDRAHASPVLVTDSKDGFDGALGWEVSLGRGDMFVEVIDPAGGRFCFELFDEVEDSTEQIDRFESGDCDR